MGRTRAILWLLLICAIPALAVLAGDAPTRLIAVMPDGRVVAYDPAPPATVPATNPAPPQPATLPSGANPPPPTPPPATVPTLPPAPPALPPIVYRVADPNAAVRGEPFNFTGPGANVLRNTHVEGWRQNITFMSGGGSLLLENVRSIKAFRETSAQRFQGQGDYHGNPQPNPPPAQWPGPLTVKGCIFGWNGYRQGEKNGNVSGYRHGIYGGRFAGAMLIEDSIFVGNACAGVQVRNGATIRRCVFLDNGVGLLSVAGDVTLEDCVIFIGHRYAMVDGEGHVTSWTGDNGVDNYTRLTLTRCLFAGAPGQAANPTATPRQFDTGCIVNSAKYRPNPDWSPAGGSITATDCVIAGWPGLPFAGDRALDGERHDKPVAGFTVKAAPVVYDPSPVIAEVFANTLSIPDVAAKLRAAVRGMAR